MSPLKAIRKRCIDCAGGSSKQVSECNEKDCSLNEFRTGKRILGKSSVKAIRKYCLRCCCKQREEVKLCFASACTLHLFRFGKNPNKKRHNKDAENPPKPIVNR